MFHMHPLRFDDAIAFLKFLQDFRKAELTFCRKANDDVNMASLRQESISIYVFLGKYLWHVPTNSVRNPTKIFFRSVTFILKISSPIFAHKFKIRYSLGCLILESFYYII